MFPAELSKDSHKSVSDDIYGIGFSSALSDTHVTHVLLEKNIVMKLIKWTAVTNVHIHTHRQIKVLVQVAERNYCQSICFCTGVAHIKK